MNTLDAFDSGSNYKFGDKLQRPMLPRSMFDMSHLVTTTIDNAGMLIPIALFKTVPNDSFELSIDSLLRVLPQVVPLYSRQRLYVHAFYSRYSDLWKNAQTYMTKGYSGNTILSKPTLTDDNLPATFTVVGPGDMFDMLGIPIGTTRAQIIGAGINALPFMMLTRIYRDYYMNRNYYIANRAWLPDDDHDFMLDDNGIIMSNPTMANTGPQLGVSYYRDYPLDYFLSAFPFPQRGDTPTLDFDVNSDEFLPLLARFNALGTNDLPVVQAFDVRSSNGQPPYTDFSNMTTGSGPALMRDSLYGVTTSTTRLNGMRSGNVDGKVVNGASQGNTPLGISISDVLLHSSITLNQLRELSSQQAILEKMARTDGSYGEFGITFFNRRSKSAQDYKPVFIGGTYQSIAFTEVLQTTPTSGAPLGAYGGHGITYQREPKNSKCDCDDYGYIMILVSIMPDTYYSQGLDRELTSLLSSEEYLPERARLGMREILNKEIYFQGNPTVDNDLFAYQTPFDELRYKPSTIHGKIADPTALSFYPYTQARHFTSLPTYSQSFARADDVRKDFLSAPVEVAYTAQFGVKVRAVRPIPYNPVPAQII